MKNAKRFVATLLAVLLLVCMPMTAFASDVDAESSSSNVSRALPVTKTVTDNDKNRYTVAGNCIAGGKTVDIGTSFGVSYYYGGTVEDKDYVDKLPKQVSVSADVTLLGGGKNTLNSSKTFRTQSDGVAAGDTYLYTVTSTVSSHSFSCNGGSITFSMIA